MKRAASIGVDKRKPAVKRSADRVGHPQQLSDDMRTARAALSAWLVAGREARGWTRGHLGRVTRIPMKTLANIEECRWDDLPADGFMHGFLRSYARCVDLPIDEALARYGECGFPSPQAPSAQAIELLRSMLPTASKVASASLRAWGEESIENGVKQVEEQQKRLREAGTIDDAGRRLVDLPDDMKPGSRTDV